MATGNYGIKRPADVSPNDIDMYVHYAPSRDAGYNNNFTKLEASQFLSSYNKPTQGGGTIGIMEGLYNLNLAPSIFNSRGIYTIVLKPKEIIKSIVDCGNLAALPDVKGIVLDNSGFSSEAVNGGLVGYRIEYFDQGTNNKIRNFF